MVELVPVPFAALVTRMFREMEQKKAIFDYPLRRMVTAQPDRDLSVSIHGHRAATPFGPAAGPHTQLAQNIVLAWLAGGRVMELKTVQRLDTLEIPRPCIDMQTVGFNVEWSQELRLDQSLEEYVKASMLIAMLRARGLVAPEFGDTVFDMSVGYDLAGIRSPAVTAFLAGMQDAGPVIEKLKAEIPEEWAALRALDYPTRLSDTLTLSTFHGCPPEEIERIGAYLLEEAGLHLVVKLNPTLLGERDLNAILHDRLGYHELEVPGEAFAKDAKWDQAMGIVSRLAERAAAAGRHFGVKFSNTLLVRNHKTFFPADQREMYMSGAPLHVLAVTLAARFRETFGDRFPISFSAGIDAGNFADAVALGLKPVSVCSDLLKVGGYARAGRYFDDLGERMAALSAPDLDQYVIRAFGLGEQALSGLALDRETRQACLAALAAGGDLRLAAGAAFPAWVSAARLINTRHYAASLLEAPRYGKEANAEGPKKIGSRLSLFDCLTCDKCIAVCPNDANFALPLPPVELPSSRLARTADGWEQQSEGDLKLVRPRQIATFADACNECGNCDIMCPEDGGPYLAKPLFFGSRPAFEAASHRNGFLLEAAAGMPALTARFDGRIYRIEGDAPLLRYQGPGFDIRLDPAFPAETATGGADGEIDLLPLRIMAALRAAVLAGVNYPQSCLEAATAQTA